jgi:protocatechuate 3,4-dioxygenase beta subunit
MSEDTDRPTGFDQPRRNVLRAIGGLGLVGAAAAITRRSSPLAAQSARRADPEVAAALRVGAVCDLTPESIEGPFYIQGEEVRADIREGKPGIALRLRFHVMNANTCEPLRAAAVDVWHCDALGVYSGEARRAEGESSDDSTTFLRGVQLSATNGWCDFQTIVPGWYPGRATHIHTKVHVRGEVADGHYTGGHVSHTGQIFFTERLMEIVETLPPYSKSTTPRLRNSEDAYYNQSGGAAALVKATEVVKGQPRKGYVGSMVLAIDPKARH